MLVVGALAERLLETRGRRLRQTTETPKGRDTGADRLIAGRPFIKTVVVDEDVTPLLSLANGVLPLLLLRVATPRVET